jgi:long-chain acyl-CoA synthetase
MAAGRLGAYSVPINWHFTADEAGYIIKDSGVKAVVTHTDLLPIAVKGVPQGIPIFAVDAPPEIAAAYHLPPADGELPPGVAVWDAWIESFPRGTPEPIEPPGPIIYTSGTTGRPKGVRRHPPTPAQTLAWTKLVARAFGFDGVLVDQEPEHIVTVLTGPMYHSAHNAYGLFAVRAGADIILQPRFDPEELLRLIGEPLPFVPGLEVQSELSVIHAQIAICIAHNGIRNDFRNLLRHDSDVELITPDVAVSIQAYAVTEASHFNNISL